MLVVLVSPKPTGRRRTYWKYYTQLKNTLYILRNYINSGSGRIRRWESINCMWNCHSHIFLAREISASDSAAYPRCVPCGAGEIGDNSWNQFVWGPTLSFWLRERPWKNLYLNVRLLLNPSARMDSAGVIALDHAGYISSTVCSALQTSPPPCPFLGCYTHPPLPEIL